MSIRILNFTEVCTPEDILFDRLTIDIKFKTLKLPICDSKSYQFEYIKNEGVYKKVINAKIRIPPTYFKCFLYIHASIINMKTMVQIIEIELQENQKSIEGRNLLVETELGPFLLSMNHQEENYVSNQIDSEMSSSTMTVNEEDSLTESLVEKYDYKNKQELTESEGASSKKEQNRQKNAKNFIKIKRNHEHFLSDGNFDSTKTG